MLHKALSLCAIFKPLMFQPAYLSITKSNIWKKSYYSEWETTIVEATLKLGWIWSEWFTCTHNFSRCQNYKNKSFILNGICLKNNYLVVFSGQVFVSKWVEFICVNKVYIRASIYVCRISSIMHSDVALDSRWPRTE